MDALYSLYPAYIFSLIMGFSPYRIDRKGPIVTIKYVKTYSVVSALLYATFICLLVAMSYSNLSAYRSQTPMQRFISFLYIFIVIGLLSVNVIFNKIYTNSTITLWKKISHIDSLIKNKGIKLNYKKMMHSILIFCISGATIHLSYIIFLMCIQKYKNLLYSISIYAALNIAISGFICLSSIFHAFFLVIGHMFEKVLEHLENKLLKNFDLHLQAKLRALLDAAVLHQELCEIARLANDVTSVQILASFAVTFALCTLQIYSVATAFNNNRVDYYFVTSSVVSVVALLGEKFNLSRVSRRCMQMINAFNLQILHDQFEITAGNFFVIDLPIFLTAGSAITTYIMLFIQADPFVDLYQSMKESVGAI